METQKRNDEKRITTKTTRIPLYCPENRIRVHIADRLKDVESFRKTLSDENEFDTADAIAFDDVRGKHKTHTIIIEREHISAGLIVHEAIHIKNHIFESIGITLDPMNDEPEAYFMQWLVDFITSVWEKDKEDQSSLDNACSKRANPNVIPAYLCKYHYYLQFE